MFSYSGPARLVYADGSTVELERVDLIETVADGVWRLSGAVTSANAFSDGAAWIKLATGAEGDVLISNVRSGPSARGVSYNATLLGADAGQAG